MVGHTSVSGNGAMRSWPLYSTTAPRLFAQLSNTVFGPWCQSHPLAPLNRRLKLRPPMGCQHTVRAQTVSTASGSLSRSGSAASSSATQLGRYQQQTTLDQCRLRRLQSQPRPIPEIRARCALPTPALPAPRGRRHGQPLTAVICNRHFQSCAAGGTANGEPAPPESAKARATRKTSARCPRHPPVMTTHAVIELVPLPFGSARSKFQRPQR